jgi:endonuclease/exonuclease/phosphatase (EEP) superfamily protein YafD
LVNDERWIRNYPGIADVCMMICDAFNGSQKETAGLKRMKRLILFIFVLFIPAFGCVTIPDTLTVESRPGNLYLLSADDWCDPEIENSLRVMAPAAGEGFNASGFSLLIWNIQKEKEKGWECDLVGFFPQADILIIQEAFLSEKFRRLLNLKPYYWHLVTAFEYQRVKTGVLTAATVESDFVCPLRVAEPLIRFPKTALITRYPIARTQDTLMIANIHMINFAPHLSAFQDQARQMTKTLINHQGPMILSGDFNTWSEERLAIIEDMAGRLTLEPVDFKSDHVRKVFGHTADRVYYRGLILEEARVIKVTSSDHNPLQVRFRAES